MSKKKSPKTDSDSIVLTPQTDSVPESENEEKIVEETTVTRVISREQYHEGPLPAPTTMAEYEQVLPGSAERIFNLTETEQAHRQDCQKRSLTAQIADVRRGQHLGAALLVLPILFSTFFFYNGSNLAGGAFLGATFLFSTIGKFIPQINNKED